MTTQKKSVTNAESTESHLRANPLRTMTPAESNPTSSSETISDRLYTALVELQIIDKSILDSCRAESERQHIPLDEILYTKDVIGDVSLGRIMGDLLSVPYINLSEVSIPSSLVYLIPEEYARRYKIIAFGETDREIKVAMADVSQFPILKGFLSQKSQKSITVYFATIREIEKSFKMYKQNLQRSYDDLLQEQVDTIGKNKNSEAPIERIVDILVEYAYDNGSSDIHLEPEKGKSIVRFRVDGILQEVLQLAPEIYTQVISRIKFLSKLRTDEHLSAQDGKIQTRIENEDLDIRVSIVPIVHGEKCVLRLLSARYRQFGLSDLGMNDSDLKRVMRASTKPFGMILSTGPTGSGKTTSMYAILKILNTEDRNIATIEDPVEYEVEGLNQIQVNAKTNLTFAEGLRSILRQDPNIIYVGEIRDDETADIAVNSAMTGHLVLSTLHTNDAATTLPRLLDMNIEPFLVASTVNIVIAQRLVRKICQKCKVSQSIDHAELEKHFDKESVARSFKAKKNAVVYIGKGCPVCKNSGYAGRVGIFEILEISEKIKELIVAKADSKKIMQQAIIEGMTTMTQDGLQKVQQGATSIEEVLRATREL